VAQSFRIVQPFRRLRARPHGHGTNQHWAGERTAANLVDANHHFASTDQIAFKLEQISGVYRHCAKITFHFI
jgi:hypothetical protein